MLKAKSLLKTFPKDVVTCVVFLLNKCHTKAIFGRTLDEAWSDNKLENFFLWVFEWIAYSHILKEHKKKFNDKSKKYIFNGYCNVTKGCKLYNVESRKLIVSGVFNSWRMRVGHGLKNKVRKNELSLKKTLWKTMSIMKIL